MKADKIIAGVEAIERVLSEHHGGEADELAKREVLGLVATVRSAGGAEDEDIRGSLASIEEYAAILYSARRHRRHPGGASQVRVWMLGDLLDIRSRVEYLAGTQ